MKRKLLAIAMSALCLAAALPAVPSMADGQKVVTLGADLSEEQRQMILRYFGVAGENIQTLTITNADEREHLGSYVPLEQIGTRTYSCALVSPTTSGGIQVKTANLTWVTSNMIATTLSTSGVVNCDVLAAAPFEVSGTGALTGILMAYEQASGTTLDETKKDTATQELVTTTQIADSIGQVEATQIVNETKTQVIESSSVTDVTNNDIDVIINEVADENDISLTDEDRELLSSLLERIAEQDYDYEEMKATLDRVEENLEQIAAAETEETEESEEDTTIVIDDGTVPSADDLETGTVIEEAATLSEDSILLNTDDSALGEDVLFDATDEAALTESESTAAAEAQADSAVDTQTDTGADATVDVQTQTDAGEDTTVDAQTQTDVLTAETDADSDELVITQEDSYADATGEDGAAETGSILPEELIFDPQDNEVQTASDMAGLDYLTIKVPYANAVGGSGSLSLYNTADLSLVESVLMNDTTKVTAAAMSEEELAEEGWTEGTVLRVYLNQSLAANTSYMAELYDESIVTADGLYSFVTTEAGCSWEFTTTGFGIGLDTAANTALGNIVSGSLVMDNSQSGYAVIDSIAMADGTAYTADGIAVAYTDAVEFYESGSFQATLNATGEIIFHVTYYDSAETMNYITEAEYTADVY